MTISASGSRILKPGLVAHGLNEDLARYRVRVASVSSRPLRSAGWVWHIYRDVETPAPAQGRLVLCALEHARLAEAARILTRSLTHSGFVASVL